MDDMRWGEEGVGLDKAVTGGSSCWQQPVWVV